MPGKFRHRDGKVLIGIGGNILTERDIDSAIEILQKRKESVQSALEKTRQQRIRLLEQIRRVQR
jgi:prefoldin subunit 5